MIKESKIICEIFKDISQEELEDWEHIFNTSYTVFFNKGFITAAYFDDMLVVNSATVGDIPFDRDMLLYLKQLGENFPNAIVTTSNPNITSLYNRGFEYDTEKQAYYRGNVDFSKLFELRG